MACGDTGACLFERAHQAWIAGDLEGLLALYDDAIEWIVYIDGITAPFASSAVGKDDLRWRLVHMLNIFSIDGFSVELMEHGPDVCRSMVHVFYVHRATGEPLDVKVHFSGWERGGRLVRFEERADAAYVEAYSRFIHFLEETNGPSDGQSTQA